MGTKKTQTIDRTLTPVSGTVQPGAITEFMTSKDTCPTTKILGTYMTLLPGGKTQLRRHNRVELAWYLLKGHMTEIIIDKDGNKTVTECAPGAAGYIAPGDCHKEINTSITDKVEMILCFAHPKNEDCNCWEHTETEAVPEG